MSLDSLKQAGAVVERAYRVGKYRTQLGAMAERASEAKEMGAFLEAVKGFLGDVEA